MIFRFLCLPVFCTIVTSLLAACGGGANDGSDVPRPQASTTLEIGAKDVKFDRKALAVPANETVTLRFVNDDSGVLHNVAIYTDKSAKEKLFAGELTTGKKTVDYSFTAPAAGVYYFRCDTHPDMNGTFYVDAPAGQASDPPF